MSTNHIALCSPETVERRAKRMQLCSILIKPNILVSRILVIAVVSQAQCRGDEQTARDAIYWRETFGVSGRVRVSRMPEEWPGHHYCANAGGKFVEPVGRLGVAILGQGRVADARPNAGANVSGKARIVVHRGYVCMQGSVAGCMDVMHWRTWYDEPGWHWTGSG